jgi:hypothetical protein
MLEAWAGGFARLVELIELAQGKLFFLIARDGHDSPLPEELRALALEAARWGSRWASGLDAPFSLEQSQYIEFVCQDPSATIGKLNTDLEQLSRRLGRELSERQFLYVPEALALLYINPLDEWGEEVPALFPSAVPEITAASECLAVGQPTAAVFHLMRLLEKGLRALATYLTIPTAKQEISTWGDLLQEIKNTSDARVATTAKGLPRKAEAEYFGALMQDFRHFKDAWRDRVSHSDRIYDTDEARSVLTHVRAFMKHLVQRVCE